MTKKLISCVLTVGLLSTLLTGCALKKEKSGGAYGLDPSNPVSLTIWHYYNGAQQAAFEELVSEFNATEGKELGIYVTGNSLGSVNDLEQAVIAAAQGEVGAEKLPDIFSSYADTAYSVQKVQELVDLREYFSDEELDEYVNSYIDEGRLNGADEVYLFPIAKSTEILMINKTEWEPFAAATGASTDELSTTEGITRLAKEYYEWTDSLTPDVPDDGKAFYGRDSLSNYIIIGMKQMGVEIFEVKDGRVSVNADKEKLRRLWDNFYVPFVNGYFDSLGRFRSDDVKTGDIIAYTGSSASAMYFPDVVELGEEITDIDYAVFHAPVMEGGENVYVQQGAGMAITKSDRQHEYAATVFIKWFTEAENNLTFGCDSAYMPVRKDARDMETLDRVISERELEVDDKTYDCLKTIMADEEYENSYTTKAFENGTAARKVLDENIIDAAKEAREAIENEMAQGKSREAAVAEYVTDEAFDAWYEQFCAELEAAIGY